MIRQPSVAGMFYEKNPDDLRATLDACFLGPYGPGRLPEQAPFVTRDIVGLVAPHAGFKYSGYAAASAYAELADDGIPDTVVIIGPNHRGFGATAATVKSEKWATPLGDVEIEREVAESIIRTTNLVEEDPRAHIYEHSIEVQLPFLQYIGGDTKIVPIVLSIVAWEDSILYAEEIGGAVSLALADRNAVVIASTDLTHYEPKQFAEEHDRKVIAKIESMDYAGLLDLVVRDDISMCGALPTAIMLAATKAMGGKKAELLSYYTSGDITGDTSDVVGYGALKVVKGLSD